MECSAAVSYTHLDVYKRQSLHRPLCVNNESCTHKTCSNDHNGRMKHINNK